MSNSLALGPKCARLLVWDVTIRMRKKLLLVLEESSGESCGTRVLPLLQNESYWEEEFRKPLPSFSRQRRKHWAIFG